MIEVVTTNFMTYGICICSDEILNVCSIYKSVDDFTNMVLFIYSLKVLCILFINKFQLKYS